MEPKVSIIAPIYRVEQYLTPCVNSLLAQTHRNLEIILVDDASPDNCPQICDEFAEKDSRIKVIHKPNGGAASARNAGLDTATGEYICFVDSDDCVEPDYVALLLRAAQAHCADIATCGFWFLSRHSADIRTGSTPCGEYSRNDFLKCFLQDWTCSLLWNKIFRREVIGSIRMEEGHKIDDEFFTYLVVMNSSKVVVTDTPLYHYRLRGSSVMQDMGPHLERIMLDRIEYITTRYRNVSEQIPELSQAFFQDALDTITRYWYHSKNMPLAQKKIRQWVNRHRSRILSMKISMRRKLIYIYQLYIKKPMFMSEPNPIQLNPDEYFD